MMILSAYRVSAASTAAVAVDPKNSILGVGSTFSVNVNVTNIVNFTAWQFTLYYQNAILSCQSVTIGPFLETGGGTFPGYTITDNYNSTHGRLVAYDTLLGATSVSGSGVLATVTFKAVGVGITNLTLASIKLSDEKIPPQEINYTYTNGAVTVTGTGHDIAVTNITPYKTSIGQGYSCNITVTVENLGGYLETFNVTLYANITKYVTSQNVTLTSGNFVNTTFAWNTTGFAYGSYNISAYAWPVPGETNTTNNNCTGGVVKVTILGDINGDFGCNLSDLTLLAKAYNTKPGDAKWNPNADINGDGTCGLSDLTIMAHHYNTHYP
jgi:hypothetical protein